MALRPMLSAHSFMLSALRWMEFVVLISLILLYNRGSYQPGSILFL